MERLQILNRHLSPKVAHEDHPYSRIITLNRPKALNSLDYEMLQTISILIQQTPEKLFIIQGCTPKSFSAGGDVVATVENPAMVPEFYRTQLSTIYQIYKQPTETLAILRGFAIGAGNGLAMACKYRISTETTRFSMPENSIGLVPDSGASYFLTHLESKALGLYLMLTGKMLDGNDLYWAGMVTHYIPEAQIDNFLNDVKASKTVLEVLNKYHQFPPREQSKLVKNMTEIEAIFGSVNSLQEIIMKLAAKPSPFKDEVLAGIAKLCPLSLHVAFKSFQLGLTKKFKQALEHDYNIVVQLCYRRSYNYTTAVTKKFIEKSKAEIQWYPENINQVTEEMINTIIRNPEGPFLDLL